MSARRLTLPRLAGLWAALTAACAEAPRPSGPPTPTPHKGGSLRFLLTEPRSLDPAQYEDAYQWQLMEQIFEGLVDFDPELNITPGLAETWTVSSDGLTYNFVLRSDARFHNGRPVTADDVAYTYLRAVRVPGGLARDYFGRVVGVDAVLAGRASSIQGLHVDGPHALTIQLARPYAPFLATLATPPFRIVAREEVEARGADFRRRPVGS